MKQILLVCALLVLPLSIAKSCSLSKEKSDTPVSESSAAEQNPGALKYTAVQGHGLYGKVKSVSDGNYTINFDQRGNIASEVWKSGGSNKYIYQSPTKYKIGDVIGSFIITCQGTTRTEKDENGIEVPVIYVFDAKGRVVSYQYAQGMRGVTEKYTYNGNEKYPNSMIMDGQDEQGSYVATTRYTYLESDKNGNWTKRKAKCTWDIIDYVYEGGKEVEKKSTKTDPEVIEQRTIVYF